MFREMRSVLNIPKTTDILEHVYSLAEPQQSETFEKIRDIERAAMPQQTPQPGLTELMGYLERRGVRRGICTRNFE